MERSCLRSSFEAAFLLVNLYCYYPAIFMKSQNIILKDSFILNPNDSVYIHSAAYKHDFLQLLVAFPIASQFKLLYFNKDGKILLIKNLSLSLSSDSFLYFN